MQGPARRLGWVDPGPLMGEILTRLPRLDAWRDQARAAYLHTQDEGRRIHHLTPSDLPSLPALCAAWCPHPIGMRLSALLPGGRVPTHNDGPGAAPIHIVLWTDPAAKIRIGTWVHHLPAGEIWQINAALDHEAWNEGVDTRLHLILYPPHSP